MGGESSRHHLSGHGAESPIGLAFDEDADETVASSIVGYSEFRVKTPFVDFCLCPCQTPVICPIVGELKIGPGSRGWRKLPAA